MERRQAHPSLVEAGQSSGRHAPALCRWAGAPAGMPRPRGGGMERWWECPGPTGYRWAWVPMAAGLRRGLGQQLHGGSWGRILAAKKKLPYSLVCLI